MYTAYKSKIQNGFTVLLIAIAILNTKYFTIQKFSFRKLYIYINKLYTYITLSCIKQNVRGYFVDSTAVVGC